jgi:hypothetical protein
MSARGWSYYLEGQGLITKGDFERSASLITECRKDGHLPLDIVAEDSGRLFANLEYIDDAEPEDEAAAIIAGLDEAPDRYTPVSFWDDQEYYLEMFVEKIDLKKLFKKICRQFRIPIASTRGWSDLNSRAAMMERFADHEADGRQCVLLYCGDHDPAGLQISDFLRSNFEELSGAVGWYPENLIIDRFGLNYEFIEEHNLMWIDNLETGSGRRLDDPRHPDHNKSYVQDYLRRFGARKVEANALVADPEGGRRLCRDTILKYLDGDSPDKYLERLQPLRDQVRDEVEHLLTERWS